MSQFNKRFNKVYLDTLSLEQTKTSLQEENERLKENLKQYLDCITVSEGVLNGPNPLLVVNGKTNAALRHSGPAVHVTIVEAAHCQVIH